jgi:UDP-3-O-[3-hydroxymyristoyl] glucosamine N-acyltransferase
VGPIKGVAALAEAASGDLSFLGNAKYADAVATSKAGVILVPVAFAGKPTAGQAFLRVDNLLDRKNCVQVFVNTGTCDAGLRDFNNRSVGNTGDATTSTALDQPEFIGARRSLAAGIRVSF